MKFKEVQHELRQVDNAALGDLIAYLQYDKISITQNIAKKINTLNEADSINYMSGALARIEWVIDTLKKCLKKEASTALTAEAGSLRPEK